PSATRGTRRPGPARSSSLDLRSSWSSKAQARSTLASTPVWPRRSRSLASFGPRCRSPSVVALLRWQRGACDSCYPREGGTNESDVGIVNLLSKQERGNLRKRSAHFSWGPMNPLASRRRLGIAVLLCSTSAADRRELCLVQPA